ncbi:MULTISPECIES: hypothetical protein [Rhizobium]|jgi:hypothetical protein|uniref:hypothetical protein n=1 Tax=Rhizobium TaxID=379 RepID=UPI001C925959|nr:hypothetical protein [Rhizobium leguminosarum]MBY2945277.1 hypothetical protein [Rhizobium leguminosarum]
MNHHAPAIALPQPARFPVAVTGEPDFYEYSFKIDQKIAGDPSRQQKMEEKAVRILRTLSLLLQLKASLSDVVFLPMEFLGKLIQTRQRCVELLLLFARFA